MGSCISQPNGDIPRNENRHFFLKISLRKTLRKLLKMDVNLNPNLYLLTDRVGHISVQYEDQLLIVWGGYDRNKPEEQS